MSQSDYIAHKKNAQILQRQTNLEAVLSSQDLTNYKKFAFNNTIKSTNITHNQLRLKNKQRIYNMEMSNDTCNNPEFIVCTNTNTRPNRVITMTDEMGKRGYKRRNGYNEYLVYQKNNNLIMPCKMFKECNKYFYLRENPLDDTDETTVIIGGL